MFSLNRVHIIGYQTQPVSVRQTPSGTSVTDLNLVTPYTFRSAAGGEMLSGKNFHVVTLWGPMAEVAGKYLRPGGQVFIGGRLQTDTWEDEQTGEKRSKTKIVALEMILLDPRDGQSPPLEHAEHLTALVNRADVIGNVTRDPEIRTTTGGQHVLTIGVATNERWKDKATNEDRERTEFHNVVIWGDLAEEVGKSVKKGNRVHVSGRVQTRSWETKEGSKRTTTEIIADTVTLLGVRSAIAEEAVQADALRMSSMPLPPAARASEPVTAAAEVPEITYASEVKVEDLPF